MYCTRNVTEDLIWVGGNDRRLAMFEGVYSVPDGVSYNSYLLLDEKTVLFDTVDKAVGKVFFENLEHALGGRKLDFVVVSHMEPDHSATLSSLLLRYPEAVVVCNSKCFDMMKNFGFADDNVKPYIVGEGDILNTGKHEFTFVMAPMVHWPEVMMTFDKKDGTLFSADAFGSFGALNGNLFADEVDFFADYLDEARRYYTNIVGKYGVQVQAVLRKAANLDIKRICPLHGFVWREKLGDYIEYYDKWSSYTPEVNGVMIAYASVYGDTENAAEILATMLRERGAKVTMYDVSVKPASEVVAAAFKYSNLVFASTTYNAEIFVRMDETIRDLVAHNIMKRTVAFIENGTWAAQSGRKMRALFENCKEISFIEQTLSLKSSLKQEQRAELEALADAIMITVPGAVAEKPVEAAASGTAGANDPNALYKLSYGLFVVTTRDGGKDNGCITNTAIQVASNPNRMAIAVNKTNYSHDLIAKTGLVNISVLTESAPFDLFTRFGFSSGRDTDKFAGYDAVKRTPNGLLAITEHTNAVFSGKVKEIVDCGSHSLFLLDITESEVLSSEPSVTYAYYFDHIKPKPKKSTDGEKKTKWVCKICGYEFEGEELPDDFICPLCKHGKEDFEKVEG
ncbi:MAG: flavin reductase [Lachnospiraceae bacterium]|nr:flavin reductase [Lachnospiraceae bacterium]